MDLEPLKKPVLPPLPGGAWDDEVRDLWNAWRKDPVTSQYSEADVAFALETIRSRQRRPNDLSEFRLRCDILGLTPKGKRDLRWRVGSDEPEEPKKRSTKKSAASRRARLSVVE